MKKISLLAILLISTIATFAGPQPTRRQRNSPNIKDILTFNNFTGKLKPANNVSGVRIYALPEEIVNSSSNQSQTVTAPPPANIIPHNFIPNPLVNYYRD
jgi:hypothetical protein